MSEIDPFKDPPLYESTQVLTVYDIQAIFNGYIYQYQATHWFNFKRRWMLRVGMGICTVLLHWLSHGKPADGMNCKGEHK